MFPLQGQAVDQLIEVALMEDVKRFVTLDCSEGLFGIAGQIAQPVCEPGGWVIAFDNRYMTEQRYRMVMTQPVILGTDQSCDPRRRDSSQRLRGVYASCFEILEQPCVVPRLLAYVAIKIAD